MLSELRSIPQQHRAGHPDRKLMIDLAE